MKCNFILIHFNTGLRSAKTTRPATLDNVSTCLERAFVLVLVRKVHLWSEASAHWRMVVSCWVRLVCPLATDVSVFVLLPLYNDRLRWSTPRADHFATKLIHLWVGVQWVCMCVSFRQSNWHANPTKWITPSWDTTISVHCATTASSIS